MSVEAARERSERESERTLQEQRSGEGREATGARGWGPADE